MDVAEGRAGRARALRGRYAQARASHGAALDPRGAGSPVLCWAASMVRVVLELGMENDERSAILEKRRYFNSRLKEGIQITGVSILVPYGTIW